MVRFFWATTHSLHFGWSYSGHIGCELARGKDRPKQNIWRYSHEVCRVLGGWGGWGDCLNRNDDELITSPDMFLNTSRRLKRACAESVSDRTAGSTQQKYCCVSNFTKMSQCCTSRYSYLGVSYGEVYYLIPEGLEYEQFGCQTVKRGMLKFGIYQQDRYIFCILTRCPSRYYKKWAMSYSIVSVIYANNSRIVLTVSFQAAW